MGFDIREFKPVDEECRAWLAVGAAHVPDRPPDTLEHFRARLATGNKNRFPHLFVATMDAKVVGCGQVYKPTWIGIQDCMMYDFMLYPALEDLMVGGQTIHSLVEAYVLKQIEGLEVGVLSLKVRDDRPARVDWLEANGYVYLQRDLNSALDVQGFNFDPWVGRVQAVEETGFAFHNLPSLMQDDPKWCSKLHRAWLEVDADVPRPYGPPSVTEAEIDNMLHKSGASPDTWMVAVDHTESPQAENFGQYAAFTAANRTPGTPTVWDIRLTGVRRAWRRRGLAIALKLKSIEQAYREGATMIVTGNEERNPMLAINQRLGFVPTVVILQYEKRLLAS
jgi:GNAT superfamily N-acetyltransferase